MTYQHDGDRDDEQELSGEELARKASANLIRMNRDTIIIEVDVNVVRVALAYASIHNVSPQLIEWLHAGFLKALQQPTLRIGIPKEPDSFITEAHNILNRSGLGDTEEETE